MVSRTILRSGSFQLRRKIIFINERTTEPWLFAVPRSWPRHGRVQSRGSTAHDHATHFELSCDLRAASNWGVLHVCHRRGCHRSHPLACAPPLAAVGIRRLELALSRLLPFLAPKSRSGEAITFLSRCALLPCPPCLVANRAVPISTSSVATSAAVFCPSICYQECGGKRAK